MSVYTTHMYFLIVCACGISGIALVYWYISIVSLADLADINLKRYLLEAEDAEVMHIP